MSDYDVIVRASAWDGSPFGLAIADGTIQSAGPDIRGSAEREIDRPEECLLPGWIDAHVHFNEPGRSAWEGLATGSHALAAGGGTAFFDMPLNSSPPVLNAAALEEKRRLAEAKSRLDFALWGGLTPDSISQIDAMADAGAIGFKAFMCPSGLDEFPASDPETLRAGMQTAGKRRLPVAVHAEIEPSSRPPGRDMAAWLASRPIDCELEAIRIVLNLAGETGCALHIVHVSCPEGIDLVTAAKAAGVDVTVETCPHYLLLTGADAIAIGPLAKCAPPLRAPATVEGLRDRLRAGTIDTIGSDHSPSSPDLKEGDDFFAMWGGIAGIQHGLPLLLDHDLAPPALVSGNVAARFRLPGKGTLTPGCDADFIMVRKEAAPVTANACLTRHHGSPYLGKVAQHRIAATFLRGEPVSDSTRGRFLRPSNP